MAPANKDGIVSVTGTAVEIFTDRDVKGVGLVLHDGNDDPETDGGSVGSTGAPRTSETSSTTPSHRSRSGRSTVPLGGRRDDQRIALSTRGAAAAELPEGGSLAGCGDRVTTAAARSGPAEPRAVLTTDRSTAFRAAIASAPDLDVQVPSCPDWTLRELVQHLGDGRRRQAAIVAAGPDAEPPARTDPKGAPTAPRDREALDAWLAESTELMLDAMRDARGRPGPRLLDLVGPLAGPGDQRSRGPAPDPGDRRPHLRRPAHPGGRTAAADGRRGRGRRRVPDDRLATTVPWPSAAADAPFSVCPWPMAHGLMG